MSGQPMRGRHTLTVPAVDLQLNSTVSFPSRATLGKNATDIIVVYSITAAIQCGAAAVTHGVQLVDSTTSEVWIELATTLAANAYDTLHITFPEGIPLYLQTTNGSGSFRSTPEKATAAALGYIGGTAPAGGYIAVTFDYVPQSALR